MPIYIPPNGAQAFPFLHILVDIFLSFFFFLMAEPKAYGISQARGWIRAAAVTYATATATRNLRHICNLYHSLQQCQVLDPLSEARAWTHILMDTALGS